MKSTSHLRRRRNREMIVGKKGRSEAAERERETENRRVPDDDSTTGKGRKADQIGNIGQAKLFATTRNIDGYK